jgi:hypothetical protein
LAELEDELARRVAEVAAMQEELAARRCSKGGKVVRLHR